MCFGTLSPYPLRNRVNTLLVVLLGLLCLSIKLRRWVLVFKSILYFPIVQICSYFSPNTSLPISYYHSFPVISSSLLLWEMAPRYSRVLEGQCSLKCRKVSSNWRNLCMSKWIYKHSVHSHITKEQRNMKSILKCNLLNPICPKYHQITLWG